MNPALDSRARFEAHRLEKTGRIPKTWGNCELVGCKVWGRLADRYVEGCEQAAWEAWQAAIASMTAPEGWQLVPVAPTDEMMGAVVSSMDEHLMGKDGAEAQYREDWAAMLAAAPTLPTAAKAAKEQT